MIPEKIAFLSLNYLLIIDDSSIDFFASIIVYIIYLLLTGFLAHLMGKKRQIGFGWSWFFFTFFAIIGGLVITLLSKRYIENTPKRSITKIIIGWILAIMCGLSSLLALPQYSETHDNLFLAIGMCGLGIYLIQIGKGKILNKAMLLEISKRKQQDMNAQILINYKADSPDKTN